MSIKLPSAIGFNHTQSVIPIKEYGKNSGKTEAQKKETKLNVLMAVALLKVWGDEYSAFLIGELNHKRKHFYEESAKASANFIKEVESSLSPESKTTLALLSEEITNGLVNLKKDLANVMQ